MMCAFMTPVLKNDWDVYQTKKAKRTSTDPTQKIKGMNQRSQSANLRKQVLLGDPRHLKDTTRSMSYHGASTRNMSDLQYIKGPAKAYHLSTRNSRTSFNSEMSGMTSPPKSPTIPSSPGNGPSKSSSSNSLSRFHNKVMDKLRRSLKKSPSQDSKEDISPESPEKL